MLPTVLSPGVEVTIAGKAFLANASVLINGDANPATSSQRSHRSSSSCRAPAEPERCGESVTVQVRNPDGSVSNLRTAQIPRILEVPFKYGQHNLPFDNFTDGIPDWGTFEDTYGTAEVWHELLDPVFGHPIMTRPSIFFTTISSREKPTEASPQVSARRSPAWWPIDSGRAATTRSP